MMRCVLLLWALFAALVLPQPLVLAQELSDGTISIEIAAEEESAGASASATNAAPVSVPQSWNMALWAFVVAVLIISFAARGSSEKSPSNQNKLSGHVTMDLDKTSDQK